MSYMSIVRVWYDRGSRDRLRYGSLVYLADPVLPGDNHITNAHRVDPRAGIQSMSGPRNPVTKLLHAIDRGESGAAAELLPLVYDELRSRAGKLIAAERRDHTLQRTALVHEAYLKLAGGELSFLSRAHFFNAAA